MRRCVKKVHQHLGNASQVWETQFDPNTKWKIIRETSWCSTESVLQWADMAEEQEAETLLLWKMLFRKRHNTYLFVFLHWQTKRLLRLCCVWDGKVRLLNLSIWLLEKSKKRYISKWQTDTEMKKFWHVKCLGYPSQYVQSLQHLIRR